MTDTPQVPRVLIDADTQAWLIERLRTLGWRMDNAVTTDTIRERIRVAILSGKLTEKFCGVDPAGKDETFLQTFERCYSQPLELRAKKRSPYDM